MIKNLQRLVLAGTVLGLAWWTPVTLAHREILLNVTHGQLPSETAPATTFFNIEDCKALGGPALKIVCPVGASFGDRVAKVTDWKSFATLEFTVFNPTSDRVTLALNIRHQQSANHSTEVDLPIAVRPGRNELSLTLGNLLNADGSTPNLARVTRWQLANTTGSPVTLFFGDISLVGDDPLPGNSALPAPINGNLTIDGGALPPGKVFHIRGSIGGQPVNLTVTSDSTSPTELTPATPLTAAPLPPAAGKTPNQSRIRPKLPEIHVPVLFNTPEADAILSALAIYPPDNPWNLVITDWPTHPKSRNIIASIGNDRPLRYNSDMAFVIVPPNQQRTPVKIVAYPDESDKGPFPVVDNTPIEGWPSYYQSEPQYHSLTLDDVQRDKLNLGGDRHGIVVDPINRMLYEFYQLKKTASGWQAAQSSVFDLKTNKLRPDGWTSADAAGLPIFPATVRYDELKRGVIDHALRVTVRRTRRAYVAPATHYASKLTDEYLPRMGERIRLRQDFDLTGFSPEVRTVLKGLQTYGMFVADNGMDWAISVTPDERIPVLHEELRRVHGSDFEVVVPPTP